MKILWIVSSGWEEGGVENGLVLMKPLLEKAGHTVKIFASDDRPDMPHFNDYSFPMPSGLFRPLLYTANIAAYRSLRRVLKEFRPDVVHVHTIGHASPLILLALRGYASVLTMHGPEGFIKSLRIWCFPTSAFRHGRHDPDDLTLKGKLRLAYMRFINGPLYALGFRNIGTIISPSNYMQNLVRGDGFESVLVPNGITLFAYHPLPPANVHEIAYVGRLEKFKGVDYLIQALPIIFKRFPDAHLTIAGDGTEREALNELARQLGVASAITFTGRIPRAQLEDVYAKASITVVPSTSAEAFGLIGIEAMSVGRPVVASNVGGIPDWLIDGVTGLLIPPKDAGALAAAVIRLFDNHSTLEAMSQAARTHAESFGIDVHVKQLIEVYASAIHKEPTR